MYKNVTPEQAQQLLAEGYRYLDVRTEGEFEQGHPEGAVNIPVLNPGMVPNDEFVKVVEANFPRDAKLLLGCKSGGRSARAAEMLLRAGYSDVVNMDGGFHGRYDASGSVVQPGWTDAGLPISEENGEGISYASLRQKAED